MDDRLRMAVLRHLATPGMSFTFGAVDRSAGETFGCRPHELAEVLWTLVGEGLVYLYRNGQTAPEWWVWRLSALGIEIANGGTWEPRDPTGYLNRLQRRAPGLDEETIRYVQEALGAFNARCYLATSVMLGVASERAFARLAEAFVNSRPAAEQPRLAEKLTSTRPAYIRRFEEFRKRLEPIRDSLPDELGDKLTLDAIGDLLRVYRNDAGHPTGKPMDEDTAFTHLQVAAQYLVKLTKLAEYFEAQAGDSTEPARA